MALELYHDPRTPVVFRPAWHLADPVIERDAEAFWRRENLLAADMPLQERMSELCMAGYDDEGALIAVSTAKIEYVGFLGCKLALFRCAVASDKRRSRLATVIMAHSREHLEQWSLAHPEEAVMGMITVTQTDAFDTRPQRGILRSSHLGFVGWTAAGNPIRVAWFEHGRVPVHMPPGAPPRSGR